MGSDSEFCGSCGYYLKNILKFLVSQFGLASLVVGYTIVGAVVFAKLECKREVFVKEQMKLKRLSVTDELWEMSKKSTILREDEWSINANKTLRDFEKSLIKAIKEDGWDGNESTDDLRWTFSGALFYSIILITTIGYGHTAPKTDTGKVVTIFYAIPGVPLMMLCLANIGDGMAHSFRFLYWKICCYACTKRPKKKPKRQTPLRNNRYPSTQSNQRPSRAPSFRKSIRASQRSNDSQLSDREFFEYSGPNYKMYNEDGDNRRSATLPERGRRGRHDDRKQKDVNVINKSVPNIREPSQRQNQLQVPDSDVNSTDGKGSVLFNKYALDKEDPNKIISTRSTPNVRHERHKDKEPDNENERDMDREMTPKERDLSREKESEKFRDRERPGSRDRGRPMSRDRRRDPDPIGQRYIQRDESPIPHSYRDSGYYSRPMSDRRSQMRNYAEKEFYYEDEYFDYEEDDLDAYENLERPVPIWLGVMLVVMYILAGAVLFMHWEGWTFLNAVYFCFITLTTIGFGDFVPDQTTGKDNNASWSIALCSLYLLFGISLLAMSFNLVQEEVISNVKAVAKRLGIIKADEEEVEEEGV